MGLLRRSLPTDDPRWTPEPLPPQAPPSRTDERGRTLETATFGGGCFWGVEIEFANTPGVHRTAVGYMGGTLSEPAYEEVCTGRTGHAEVVQLEFDPEELSYERLVERFLSLHDPTQVDRQGPDVGTQYRSVVFAHTPEQEAAARAVLELAAPRFRRPIATKVVPASAFWRAEDYHQRYLEKRGLASCAIPAG